MELLEALASLLADERTPLLGSQNHDAGFETGQQADEEESFSGFQVGHPGRSYSRVSTLEFGRQQDRASPMWYNAANDTAIVRGLVPCTNCCIAVPQDRWIVVEKFGKFEAVLEPGLHSAGWDLLGCCVQFRGISKRVQQQVCNVSSITKDRLFVTVHVAVQRSVLPENVGEAIYSVTDMSKQVEAGVADIIRSLLPQHTLDELFALSEELSESIRAPLAEQLGEYGVWIHRVNVTDIKPANDVMEAMNNVKVQSNNLEKSILEADATKICTLRRAEASADALALQGQGTARLRGAVVGGFSQALEQLTQPQTLELMLMSEYCEMLKELVSKSKGHTHAIFVKRSEGDRDTGDAQKSKKSPLLGTSNQQDSSSRSLTNKQDGSSRSLNSCISTPR